MHSLRSLIGNRYYKLVYRPSEIQYYLKQFIKNKTFPIYYRWFDHHCTLKHIAQQYRSTEEIKMNKGKKDS